MSKDDGRVVRLFGRDYIWLRSEAGALQLHAVDRMNAAMREVADALRERPTSA